MNRIFKSSVCNADDFLVDRRKGIANSRRKRYYISAYNWYYVKLQSKNIMPRKVINLKLLFISLKSFLKFTFHFVINKSFSIYIYFLLKLIKTWFYITFISYL